MNEISVMDNKGEKPLSENELRTVTEIRTDIYEIKPEYENDENFYEDVYNKGEALRKYL